MKVLKIAVVGAGLIGRAHIRTVSAQSGCELLAIVDPSSAACELAEQYGVPLLASIEVLLASYSPDGIILATPNQLHVSHASLCLNAGVPTLLEKPVATTSADGAVLADVVHRTGIPLLVGHHRTHGEIMSKACEVIDPERILPTPVTPTTTAISSPAHKVVFPFQRCASVVVVGNKGRHGGSHCTQILCLSVKWIHWFVSSHTFSRSCAEWRGRE